jgi:catechol 2,3-dioxygenase-like lactoylglutathione lyase family enzyme
VTTFVRNIVLASPGASWDEYVEEGRKIATFYAELLGMNIIREDWYKIARDPEGVPQLAFGDGPGAYVAPVWGDPERSQQMHIDIAVPDLHVARKLVEAGGATLLADYEVAAAYADPIGHPFCLYAPGTSEPRVGRIVIDCFSPRALASFYAELLGMKRVEDSSEDVVIAGDDPDAPQLAFQHAVFAQPRWPDPKFPQQVHLDIYSTDAPAARELAVSLGAIPLPAMGGSAPVFADPSGHPFCLCAMDE